MRPEFLRYIGQTRVGILPLAVLVWLAVLIPAALFLRCSVFGRYLDAIGANPRAAWASGLPYVRVVFAAHILSSLFAVLSAFLLRRLRRIRQPHHRLRSRAEFARRGHSRRRHLRLGPGGVLGPAVASFMLMFILQPAHQLRARRAGQADGARGDHRARGHRLRQPHFTSVRARACTRGATPSAVMFV